MNQFYSFEWNQLIRKQAQGTILSNLFSIIHRIIDAAENADETPGVRIFQ